MSGNTILKTGIMTIVYFLICNLIFLGVMAVMGQTHTAFELWSELIPALLVFIVILVVSVPLAFFTGIGASALFRMNRPDFLKVYLCYLILLAAGSIWMFDCTSDTWNAIAKGGMALGICAFVAFKSVAGNKEENDSNIDAAIRAAVAERRSRQS